MCLTISEYGVNTTITRGQKLFSLELIANIHHKIQLSCQCPLEDRLLLALTTTKSHNVILILKLVDDKPKMKTIEWPTNPSKKITAFCFNPSGDGLFCATRDGSLYITDTLIRFEKKATRPYILKMILQCPYSPSTVAWLLHKELNIGIITNANGVILFVNLMTKSFIGSVIIGQKIKTMEYYEDKTGIVILTTVKNNSIFQVYLENCDCFRNLTGNLGYRRILDVRIEQMNMNIVITPQYDKEDKQLCTWYNNSTGRIEIHRENAPDCVHKIIKSCQTTLLARNFFFLLDNERKIYIVSTDLSAQNNLEVANETYNTNPILGIFSFENEMEKEKIISIYVLKQSQNIMSLCEYLKFKIQYADCSANNIKKQLYLDSCIIVTTKRVLCVNIKISILETAIALIVDDNDLKKGLQFVKLFDPHRYFMEYMADCLISRNRYSQAVVCYKLAKSKIPRCVKQLPLAECTSIILHLLIDFFSTIEFIELPIDTKTELSNICLDAFMYETTHKNITKAFFEVFLDFLAKNTFYNEIQAIDFFFQNNHWSVAQDLVVQRNLHKRMLCILIDKIQISNIGRNTALYNKLIKYLTKHDLMETILLNNKLGRLHMLFVTSHLQDFNFTILWRLMKLYNPTNVILRSKVIKRIKYSQWNHDKDKSIQSNKFTKSIIETYIEILLTYIHKQIKKINFFYNIHLSEIYKRHWKHASPVTFTRNLLSAGFCHVTLIRKTTLGDKICTWGVSAQGCLGTGPSVLRYSVPVSLDFFSTMELTVCSVSSGICHTLTVTENGIYSWGSNRYGQLGLGDDKILQCPTPRLITSLARKIIIEVAAGAYHSVALTQDGKVFTWGWSYWGQLGYGYHDRNRLKYIENTPREVPSLSHEIVRHISAGYAHTLILCANGTVYAFGANKVGQLGIDDKSDYFIAKRVLLQEKIRLINAGYFHNLAVSNTNKLYTWGATPDNYKVLNFEDLKKSLNHNLHEETKGFFGKNSIKFFEKNPTESDDDQIKPNLNIRIINTSLVEGQIIQISAGCYHNALITDKGFIYTWGLNFNGQIGNGQPWNVEIPTLLYHNLSFHTGESYLTESMQINLTNIVEVACGYDYTVAVQAEGIVLAWGDNTRAQLGMAKTSTNQFDWTLLRADLPLIVSLPYKIQKHTIFPLISNQEIESFAEFIYPTLIKRRPRLTLHYILEFFHGLYDSSRITKKCKELKNYQAASQIAMLDGNINAAFLYQLEMLHKLSLKSGTNYSITKKRDISREIFATIHSDDDSINDSTASLQQIINHTEWFNKMVEDHLESLKDRVTRKRKNKSRSLNNLQTLAQDLHTFDYPGSLKRLHKNHKNDEQDTYYEKSIFFTSSQQKSYVINQTTTLFNFYLSIIGKEAETLQCELLKNAIIFWIKHDLPIQVLENIFLQHDSIIYSLGLLLSCENNIDEELRVYYNTEKHFCAIDLFSNDFCCRVLCLMLQNINMCQKKDMHACIKLLFFIMFYCSSKLLYLETEYLKTELKQRIGIIIRKMFPEMRISKLLMRVEMLETTCCLLETRGYNIIFTCGHYFPISLYDIVMISKISYELVKLGDVDVLSDLHSLSKKLNFLISTSSCRTYWPLVSILCPLCIIKIIKTTNLKMKKSTIENI